MSERRCRVAITLVLVGVVLGRLVSGQTVPSLTGLRDDNPAVRAATARQIAQRAGPLTDAAMPELVRSLGDSEAEVRYYVAVSMAAAAYSDRTSAEMLNRWVPSLLPALKDRDARVREYVANAIGLIMPAPGAEAVEPLIALLEDTEGAVRRQAAAALSRVNPVTPRVTGALLKAYAAAAGPELRGVLLDAMSQTTEPNKAVVDALISGLDDSDVYVKGAAIRGLTRLGPRAADAVAPLKRIVADQNAPPAVRRNAEAALRRITG